ncbi:acetylxylan esterase, partial [Parabacteroides distasonis]
MRWGMKVYGILTVPVKPGKYPALLRVPGAGVRPYGGDIYTAGKGAIVLEICIHGIPVTMQQSVYDDLHNNALDGYWESNIDNRDKNHYKRVFIGAIRALDYIAEC